MKRIFAFFAAAVLVCSLLAAPCFAAEPESLPVPLPGVTDPKQPEEPEPTEKPSIQLYDAFPGNGDIV